MFERLLDKSASPSEDELALYCGENGGRFRALNERLSERYGASRELRFPYGNGYGWCVTHRRGKRLVCDVFAEAGAFTVMLRLSDRQFEAAYPELRPYARSLVDGRYPCGDGGWIHFRVTDDDGLEDVLRLLDEKCRERTPRQKGGSPHGA